MKIISITFLISLHLFASGASFKVYKNTSLGYSAKYPADWQINLEVPNDESDPSKTIYGVSFSSKECSTSKLHDCYFVVEAQYPTVAKSTFIQVKEKLNRTKYKSDDKKLRSFKLKVRNSDYPVIVQKISSLETKNPQTFRSEVYFDCGNEQIYKVSSSRVFSGDLTYFDKSDEATLKEKILSPVVQDFLESFNCPSHEFIKSKEYKKIVKKYF